ncbi:MAG: patatin family protein [Bacteroides sp.]|nr:patatin family protein [Bacteroides sp.]
MKTGLVLEGGASRTYFSCGVMDRMLELGIFADYVIGVSAGISFGVSYTSRQLKRNYRIMTQYQHNKSYAGVRHLVNRKNKSYYNLDYVFGEIPNKLLPFDYETFDNRTGSCIAVVTGLESGSAEYIELPRDREFTALRATCALPLLFAPVEINGKLYMDGGVSDSIPYEKAFEDDCDRVIVLLTRPRGYVKGYEKATPLVKTFYKKYPNFLNSFLNRPERYNKSMERLLKLEEAGKAFVIAPDDVFGVGRTERDPKKLTKLYDEGYEQCRREESRLIEFIAPRSDAPADSAISE